MGSLPDGAASNKAAGGMPPLLDVPPEAFFDAIAVNGPGESQCVVLGRLAARPDGTARMVFRNMLPSARFSGAWATPKVTGAKLRYHTHFTYATNTATGIAESAGRTADNARRTRVFVADIDAGEAKHAKNPEGTYANGAAAEAAVEGFVARTGLAPNFLVRSGSGGLHLYFLLDAPIGVNDWTPRAKCFMHFMAANNLKADPSVTADAARIMRAPGSVHSETGARVNAFRWREEPYSLAEFERLIGFDAAAVDALPALPNPRHCTRTGSINDDVLAPPQHDGRPASLARVADHCQVIRLIRDTHGNVPEPHWRGGAGVAKFCAEDGEALFHEWSSGYGGYSRREAQGKLDRWDTGPSTCAHLAEVSGKCGGCPHWGQITSPVQLGREPAGAAPAATDAAPNEGASGDGAAPEYVQEMNRTKALVRIGSKMVIGDFRTPYTTPSGVGYGLGYLDVEAFRSKYRGRFAPRDKPGEKPRPLADAWLSHPMRRQYDGVGFAPGETVPPNILNLWQGFAVTPASGDVSLWLTLLEELIKDETTRRYVLMWLAWKVQNPGGVPDTVLIFTGGKGTGKNSLLSPMLTIFGRHGMLADDPELIAGRFTYHLMHLAFGVLDEAVFVGDPRQSDRIKSRITARHMLYEQKGFDPVPGINRAAYVMLTNHAHAWQATTDERRAVVIEAGDGLRGNFEFWTAYHAWADGPGPAALLHHLQSLDVSGFNPRAIPRSDALARQVELTALRDPAVSWWRTCLEEGCITVRDGAGQRREPLHEDRETEIDRNLLRRSFEDSATGRARGAGDWHVIGKRLNTWTARRETKRRDGTGGFTRRDILPPLPTLREMFTAATGVTVQ